MYPNAIPKIRIDIDSMRHGIISMLNDKHDDLLKCVNAGIDAALIELPMRVVREAKDMSEKYMIEALETALKEYWEHGQGRGLIDAAIEKKFNKVKF